MRIIRARLFAHNARMTDTTPLQSARRLFARYGDADSDAAWLLIDPYDRTPQATGPAIYVCDAAGRTLVLVTAVQALQRLSAQTAVDETEFEQIKVATDVLLEDMFNSDRIHPDTRRGVILGAALCIAETRGFHITKHHGSNVQHLLLRYPNAVSKHHALVPMPLFKSHPIAPLDLNAAATHVLLSEQLNFPERFAGDKPLSFVEARRNVLAGRG
jgi:hypothetical protein